MMKGVMKLKNKKILDINNLLKNIKSIDKIELDNENFKFDIKFMFGEDMVAYVNKNMEFHREDGPARIIYYKSSGKIKEESYLINGEYHRDDEPAIIKYRSDNTICEECYERYNILHRTDGPAYITYYPNGEISNSIYYLFGQKYNFVDDFTFAVYTASLKEIEEDRLKLLSQKWKRVFGEKEKKKKIQIPSMWKVYESNLYII